MRKELGRFSWRSDDNPNANEECVIRIAPYRGIDKVLIDRLITENKSEYMCSFHADELQPLIDALIAAQRDLH